jgi:hypothetical protein
MMQESEESFIALANNLDDVDGLMLSCIRNKTLYPLINRQERAGITFIVPGEKRDIFLATVRELFGAKLASIQIVRSSYL